MNNICIVCFANFCRSPVAEKILQEIYPHKVIRSAGLSPMISSNMDKRSVDFLISKNIKNIIHNPSAISSKHIKEADIIYALDINILFELNKKFPKYKNKFKLFNYIDVQIDMSDPYKMNLKNYNNIMENIYKVCGILPL